MDPCFVWSYKITQVNVDVWAVSHDLSVAQLGVVIYGMKQDIQSECCTALIYLFSHFSGK